MSIPEAFRTLLRDPAPGLVFSASNAAGVGRRTVETPHVAGAGAGWLTRRTLRQAFGKHDGPFKEIEDLWRAHDGLSLCLCRDAAGRERPRAALSFLPVRAWDAATWTAEDTDDGRLFSGLDEIYRPGSCRVIASSPNEGTLLTVLLEDGEDPLAKAGCIYYLSLRPRCERAVPLAPSLNALLDLIARNPAGFFHSLGFCGRIADPDGVIHDDEVEAYVPDVHAHADVRRAAA